MELKWIEDFLALAQYQSFSRAADMRNVTQSGFSRRIQALEQWAGADLIDRSRYPPSLTPAGLLFRETAEDVVAKLVDTRAVIHRERKMAGSGLQIAAGHTIALNFLPTWLNSLDRHLSHLRMRVIPANVHDSVLMLVNGNCELMFAYHHPDLPLQLDPERYQHLSMGRDLFLPVCRPNQRSGPAFRLPGTPAKPLPLIAYTDTTYFGRCFAHLLHGAEAVPSLRPHYESDMAEVLKKMVLNGEGIAWLPQSAIQVELDAGTLIPAGGRAWALPLELRVYRDVQLRNDDVEKLWQHLRAVA
jgi:DNA-binding transcriptional LysR family regulator